MTITTVLSAQKREALATVAAVQGDSGTCEIEQSQYAQVAGHFQAGADVFSRLQRAFGRIGWSLYSLDSGAVVASNAASGLLAVCPDNRAASALLRTLEG